MLARRLRVLAGQALLPWRLRRALPAPVREVAGLLTSDGHAAYLVGGCVRDLLMGAVPKDWDLATGASAGEMLALFPGARAMGSGRGGTGPAGAVTVLVVREGLPVEVAPFRGDDRPVGASPQERLAADLARRDFTVNAMALDLSGRLFDPVGGRQDLARGRVAACGSAAERFSEDPLRMLRAVRVAAASGFRLDAGIAAGVSEVGPDSLCGVAPERIGSEMCRLLLTARPAWAMERLREFGLLAVFAPELLEMVGVEQNEYHRFPVWEHALLALAAAPPDLAMRWAALLHDIGKPRTASVDESGRTHFYGHERVGAEMAADLLERLRVDGRSRERAVHLIRHHMDLHLDGEVTDGAIRRMLRRIGPEYLGDLLQLRRADRIASGMRQGDLSHETVALAQRMEQVLEAEAALKVTDLAVTGDDVIAAFGRPPGPYVGQVLGRLLEEVLEQPELNRREELLRRLAEWAADYPCG